MQKIILTLALAAATLTATAVPADRTPRRVRLADGTTIIVRMHGDEHHSWLSDANGCVIEPNADGRTFRRTRRTDADETERHATAAARAPRRIGSQATAPLPATGSPRVPVVLVNFADSVFNVGLEGDQVITSGATSEQTRAYYDRFCNGKPDADRTSINGNYGAIRDYFRAQSDGKFTPEFTIIGPVTLAKPESYYGENYGTDGGSKDRRYSEFRNDAIAAATAAYDGDWMDFDNKHKGQVDIVFFIYAGAGENTAYVPGLLWPKEGTSSTTINGIKFATSGCCCENQAALNDNRDAVVAVRPDGIGVMCHELSHALGLPDFYDTSYNAFGMDLWSLMDYGCYAGGGRCPGGYTAYERDFMGWRQLETLTEWGTYTLQPTDQGGKGYKLTNPENPDEYYILENRQRSTWDRAICQRDSGMLVTHVDFDQNRWNGNRVNTDAQHQRMTIIAANNLYKGTTGNFTEAEIYQTWSGNLFPFQPKDASAAPNDSLTANSTPPAAIYTTARYMPTGIHAITLNPDNTVSFYLGNDYVNAINDLQATRDAESSDIFDLAGRRVAANPAAATPLRPGIYLRAGRKHFIR